MWIQQMGLDIKMINIRCFVHELNTERAAPESCDSTDGGQQGSVERCRLTEHADFQSAE